MRRTATPSTSETQNHLEAHVSGCRRLPGIQESRLSLIGRSDALSVVE